MKRLYQNKWLALCMILLIVFSAMITPAFMKANVGPYYGGFGTNNVVGNALTKTGDQRVAQSHGKYYAANEDGKVYGASLNAGAAPGQTISTTACAVLYNPQGSGVNVSILKVSIGYVSGTLGTGTMFHCVNMTNTQTAPSGGTTATGGIANLGGGGAGQAVFRQGATVVAPIAYRPFVTLDPMLATSVLGLPLKVEDMDGEILLPPGTSYQVQSIAAAGTSPLVSIGVVWRELPAN